MKKAIALALAPLCLFSSLAMADDFCRVVVGVDAAPQQDKSLTPLVFFNVTDDQGSVMTSKPILPGMYDEVNVPCDNVYSIAATEMIIKTRQGYAMASAANDVPGKGSYSYKYGNVTLRAPHGSVAVSFPEDFNRS